jgi:predicted nucleic acid-binding protein
MPEKNWVFDAVVLSNFLLSDSILILEERYRNCGLITWQVYDEISAGMIEYPNLRRIDTLIGSQVLELITLSGAEHKHFLDLIGFLGKGEAACIAVAKKRGSIVVTDDRAARGRCSLMKIPFTGTIGILKAAFLQGQLSADKADEILARMIEAGFYSPIRSMSDIL